MSRLISSMRLSEGGKVLCINYQVSELDTPNARHHPRPYSTSTRGIVEGRRVDAVVRRAAKRVGRAAVLISDGCVVMEKALGLDAITFY